MIFPATKLGENEILVVPKFTNSPSLEATKSLFLFELIAMFGRTLKFLNMGISASISIPNR